MRSSPVIPLGLVSSAGVSLTASESGLKVGEIDNITIYTVRHFRLQQLL